MLLVVAQGFWWALLSVAAPLLAPLRALAGLSLGVGPRGTASALVLLATLLAAPLTAPLAPPTPSSTLAAVSGLLRKVRSGVANTVVGAPTRMATSAASRSAVVFLELLGRSLPPVNDSVTASSMLREMGYPMETHFVTTQDGYRLRLERVANPGRQPVFLAHGMETAAPSFVLLGRDDALAPLLYDAGYDVWLVNYRGTHYSLGHTKYTVRDEAFWDFSWHEHGALDNPAAIDYVLARTRFPSVLYAGHSMGATSFMVMASTRPEYQRKVRAAFLLAPAGPLHHHASPVVGLLHATRGVTEPLVDALGLRRTIMPIYLMFRRAIRLLLPHFGPILYMFTYAIVGYRHNATYYSAPHFFDTIPSGGSWGEVFHYVQNADHNSRGFRQYDHGARRNRELYGTPQPPQYDLKSIRTPIHAYLGNNDILCTKEDMQWLFSQLPNVVDVHVDPDDTFNHMDFFASTKLGGGMNRRVVADMQRFSSEHIDKDNAVD